MLLMDNIAKGVRNKIMEWCLRNMAVPYKDLPSGRKKNKTKKTQHMMESNADNKSLFKHSSFSIHFIVMSQWPCIK